MKSVNQTEEVHQDDRYATTVTTQLRSDWFFLVGWLRSVWWLMVGASIQIEILASVLIVFNKMDTSDLYVDIAFVHVDLYV